MPYITLYINNEAECYEMVMEVSGNKLQFSRKVTMVKAVDKM
ncbi:hypothetical protein [Chryseobacterium lactis]|nr:hypothetical protein [Chryseobacterium lactis]